MQNRDAYATVRVNCGAHTFASLTVGVPHFGLESHLRRVVRVVLREAKDRLKVTALHEGFRKAREMPAYLVESVFGTLEDDGPHEEVVIVDQSD